MIIIIKLDFKHKKSHYLFYQINLEQKILFIIIINLFVNTKTKWHRRKVSLTTFVTVILYVLK